MTLGLHSTANNQHTCNRVSDSYSQNCICEWVEFSVHKCISNLPHRWTSLNLHVIIIIYVHSYPWLGYTIMIHMYLKAGNCILFVISVLMSSIVQLVVHIYLLPSPQLHNYTGMNQLCPFSQ